LTRYVTEILYASFKSSHGMENEGDNSLQNFPNLDIQGMGDEERLNAVRALLA